MNKHNYLLNEVAIYLIMRFLRRVVKHTEDIRKYHFDLPQFEIDLCREVNNLLVELNCPTHFKWTADFTCRGRTTAYRNTKKQPK